MHFGGNESLVLALVSHSVGFVIIGGTAVAWHCPQREARDLDIMLNPTADNSKRTTAALRSINLHVTDYDWFSVPGRLVKLDRHLFADLLTPKLGAPTFREVSIDAEDAVMFGVHVRVAAIPAMLQLKRLAAEYGDDGLDKHLRDLALLERALADQNWRPKHCRIRSIRDTD